MCLHPRVSEMQVLHCEDPREVCSHGRQTLKSEFVLKNHLPRPNFSFLPDISIKICVYLLFTFLPLGPRPSPINLNGNFLLRVVS